MSVRLTALCATLAVLAATLSAQDNKGSQPDEKAMMEAMAKHAAPGEHHKAFEPLVGKWNYVGKMFMGPQAMEMKGTSERSMLLGGRFLADTVKSAPGEPMPFEGKGWTGYDNHRKKYFYVWIDTMSTGTMTAEGTYDARTKTFTYHNEGFDPMEGKMVKGKDVTVIKSNDEHTTTFYKLAGGQEVKVMEITAKRVK
jgi:hypothetical protein